jgi:AcrR family transcriptional regulator
VLGAVLDVLRETGYERLSIEAVAARARASRQTVHRRWRTKPDLVAAAFAGAASPLPDPPDTGELRGDLLAYLTGLGEARAAFFAVAAATAFSGLLTDTGLTVAQAREKVTGSQSLPTVRVLYQRAHDRGEIDLARVPAAVLAMPFDLVRHDLLMHARPPEPARVEAIVDDVFLPLVRGGRTPPPPAPRRRG